MPHAESEYPKDIIPIDQNVIVWGNKNDRLYNEWPFLSPPLKENYAQKESQR